MSSVHATHMDSGLAQDATPFIDREQGDQRAHIGRDHSSDHHEDPTGPDLGSTTVGADVVR